jgi:hypothetical protein
MRVQSQASVRSHVLDLPALSLAACFRPFAAKVLAWAGVAANAPARSRARAVVGWFAANAVHPQAFLHPNGTTKNTSVLPAGETWASFNAAFYTDAAQARDQAFWYGLFPNGITMLQKLIGTTAADGTITDDGMLTEYQTGKWRIRNFANFRAPQCTLQCKMAQVVLAAIGIPSVDISTVGHDPMAFYDIEAARWSYIDPTFGEMLIMFGRDQTPLDLLQANLSGYGAAIASDKLPGADYIPVGYYTSPNLAQGGMSIMTVHTAPQWAGGLSARAPYRFGDLPSQSAANDRPGTMAQIMPQLGVGIADMTQSARALQVRLRSSWPAHSQFQRSRDAGVSWAACSATDIIARDSGEYLYRSIDADGFAGTMAEITA